MPSNARPDASARRSGFTSRGNPASAAARSRCHDSGDRSAAIGVPSNRPCRPDDSGAVVAGLHDRERIAAAGEQHPVRLHRARDVDRLAVAIAQVDRRPRRRHRRRHQIRPSSRNAASNAVKVCEAQPAATRRSRFPRPPRRRRAPRRTPSSAPRSPRPPGAGSGAPRRRATGRRRPGRRQSGRPTVILRARSPRPTPQPRWRAAEGRRRRRKSPDAERHQIVAQALGAGRLVTGGEIGQDRGDRRFGRADDREGALQERHVALTRPAHAGRHQRLIEGGVRGGGRSAERLPERGGGGGHLWMHRYPG